MLFYISRDPSVASCVTNVYLDPYFLHQTTQGNVIFFILSLVVFSFHYRGRGGVVCAIGDMDGFFMPYYIMGRDVIICYRR